MREMTIADAVAAYLSAVRTENGFTLDQVAQAARLHGASWSASSVSNIERGQASLTLPTLLLLGLALSNLTERPLSLSNLLGDAEGVLLGRDGVFVSRAWLDSVLAGGPMIGALSDTTNAENDPEWDEELEEEVLRAMRAGRPSGAERPYALEQFVDDRQAPPEMRSRVASNARRASLAEERAAKRLGIPVNQMQQLAVNLWGRALESEAAERAGVGSTPQARGRVTRVLVDEIRASMESEG